MESYTRIYKYNMTYEIKFKTQTTCTFFMQIQMYVSINIYY